MNHIHRIAPHRMVGPARYSKPLQAEHPPRNPRETLNTGPSGLDLWMVASALICIGSALSVLGFVAYVLIRVMQ